MEASNTEETFNNGKKKHASVIAWTEVGATSGWKYLAIKDAGDRLRMAFDTRDSTTVTKAHLCST